MLSDGSAFEKFRQLVELQGGDAAAITDPSRFQRAAHQQVVRADVSGYIEAIHSEQIGVASMMIGAGRERLDSVIDHAVGLMLRKKVGDRVEAGEPLCVVEYNDAAKLEAAVALIRQAYRIGANPPAKTPLIRAIVTA